ncbi:MAG: threonylcarbamoyl-AMP synthase [Planctomycetales bacterium]|nr:threonylcarbamoyl-AMP synthase [Planctomycetales bacterium]
MYRSKIRAASKSAILEAARFLAEGKLVGVPTETVYGLAADATNPIAVGNIFAAKGRPANNPLIVHVDSAESALRWVCLGPSKEMAEKWRLACEFWPGPLTVVVPRAPGVIDQVTAGSPTVAVRVPSHPVMRSLLQNCDFPIAAPSANRSNYVSPTNANHVQEGLGDKVAMILDGGECQCGLESTIIRLAADGVELLRPGSISLEQLESKFGSVSVVKGVSKSKALDTSDRAPMPAPGMLAKHYSPSTPLRTAGNWDPAQIPPSRVARLTFFPLPDSQSKCFRWYRSLSQTGDLDEVAQNLFTALRQADLTECEWIVIDQCDRSGVGRAIMDRIDRAASDPAS